MSKSNIPRLMAHARELIEQRERIDAELAAIRAQLRAEVGAFEQHTTYNVRATRVRAYTRRGYRAVRFVR